jgi:Cys-rich protein (TIGR01571 family)
VTFSWALLLRVNLSTNESLFHNRFLLLVSFSHQGQILQRLKLNAIGMPGNSQNTCKILTGAFFAAWFLTVLLGALTDVGYVVWYAFYFYIVVAIALARNNFRKRYNIPGTACGDSACDDCVCAYFCGCCTILQMHRHTHDEKEYPYDMTSETGLPKNAPEIV